MTKDKPGLIKKTLASLKACSNLTGCTSTKKFALQRMPTAPQRASTLEKVPFASVGTPRNLVYSRFHRNFRNPEKQQLCSVSLLLARVQELVNQ